MHAAPVPPDPPATGRDRVGGLRLRVERALAGLVVSRETLTADCPDDLRAAIAHSLLAGGKRLRPVLVLLGCEACGGDADRALPLACAVELVHTYSLVHDDLPAMDDDDLRRGRPTCHRAFDEATAILAGDAMLTLAFELAPRGLPGDVAAACVVELARAAGACGMVGGQAADLAAERDPAGVRTGDRLEAIHRRKTGALLACCPSLGARAAGADESRRTALLRYGRNLGLAFQIADDLLDLTGDAQTMGKAVRKDAGSGKLTYPALYGVGESRRRAADLVAAARAELGSFGPAARPLDELARFVLDRDH